MKNKPLQQIFATSYVIHLYIAGDYNKAQEICRQFCMEQGFCVSLERNTYIYTGGQEDGIKVTIVNYPRFPKDPIQLDSYAHALLRLLIEGLHQGSGLMVTPTETFWYSRRGDTK